MQISRAIRTIGRKLLGPRLTPLVGGFVRRHFRTRVKDVRGLQALFRCKCGLEIGGPSPTFSDEGPVPVYCVLRTLDNCLFSTKTIWTGRVEEGAPFRYHELHAPGRQLICDATELRIGDGSYDCVLSCHCLEHIANPLKALHEWKRILKPNGLLLLVLPHKDGTFDWRRPTTSIAHIIQDYENYVTEDDLTHVPEVLALHDFERDTGFTGPPELFRQLCQQNALNRILHHHVFDTATALMMVDHAGFQVIRVDTLKRFHIVIVARKHPVHPEKNFGASGEARPSRRTIKGGRLTRMLLNHGRAKSTNH